MAFPSSLHDVIPGIFFVLAGWPCVGSSVMVKKTELYKPWRKNIYWIILRNILIWLPLLLLMITGGNPLWRGKVSRATLYM